MASGADHHGAAGPQPPESIGALLTRLRLARGFSQLRVAQRLCAAAGMPTVSRHEVSRWEREERLPGSFWLGWLSVVLETPLEELEAAMAVARGAAGGTAGRRPPRHRLWRPPTTAELLTALDRAGTHDVVDLAHSWLVGPPEPPPAAVKLVEVRQTTAETLDRLATRVADLRRMDDLIGGLDLIELVDRELRDTIAVLDIVAGAGHQRRALRLVAQYAQLAGWVRADAGDPAGARRAYRVALRTAAAGGDRQLAAHVLGSLSHHTLATGDPQEALLLARTAHSGARPDASAFTQALLLHRVALAAARVGERRLAYASLAAAERVADRSEPDREPPWLRWLDRAELSAMRGRCLAALGRPLRAVELLAQPRRGVGPRTISLYQGCLARAYVDVGEVELACRIARRALREAVRAGSVRAAAGLRSLHPVLLRHRDLPAVRGYERIAADTAALLPAPLRQSRVRSTAAPRADTVDT